MKLYLSSYELGDHPERLAKLFDANKRIAYIPNACDYTDADLAKKTQRNEADMAALRAIGLETELLDLREYFGCAHDLHRKIGTFGGVFVRGGNTFILRQAMRLSGLDGILSDLRADSDFVYSGYSAGVCVLASDFESLRIVDDPTDLPYIQIREPIWEGLGFLPYMVLPHYKSDHPESADIDREVEYCIGAKIPFVALRDGEVLVFDS